MEVEADVSLKQVALAGGIPLGQLSKLAISGCFPSTATAGRRRTVNPQTAEALVGILRAGYTNATIIQAILADPHGVAQTALLVAALAERGS